MCCVLTVRPSVYPFFFFNDTATTEIYTLSLHDALPISTASMSRFPVMTSRCGGAATPRAAASSPPTWTIASPRSEEHTSELQSHLNLVCRLLLEKKKKTKRRKPAIQSTPQS